jgi:hypothetical protein
LPAPRIIGILPNAEFRTKIAVAHGSRRPILAHFPSFAAFKLLGSCAAPHFHRNCRASEGERHED